MLSYHLSAIGALDATASRSTCKLLPTYFRQANVVAIVVRTPAWIRWAVLHIDTPKVSCQHLCHVCWTLSVLSWVCNRKRSDPLNAYELTRGKRKIIIHARGCCLKGTAKGDKHQVSYSGLFHRVGLPYPHVTYEGAYAGPCPVFTRTRWTS